MAARRKRRKRPTKLKARRSTLRQSDRDRALLVTAGKIGLYALSNPEFLRGAGAVLEVLGRAMQRSADSTETTAPTTPTQLPPGEVFDLSAFRARKKEPSDGKENL